MRNISVSLGDRTYRVQVGEGLDIAAAIAGLGQDFVLIHDAVFCDIADGQYLARVRAVLQSQGRVAEYAVPSGEKSKSLAFYSALSEAILVGRITRETVVVALGGGVVGDLAGFLAASLLRGLRFVQIPTTLLAQVDSSVGGKVGINAQAGKNLIGAFHQPQHVLADLDFLAVLPAREFAAGMAEVLKAALLADAEFWQWLQENTAAINSRTPTVLTEMIARAVAIKADVVASDEQEKSGRRALLNLGHTFAHALEAAVAYDGSRLVHGEAVAIGMVMAARLSVQQGHIAEDGLEQITATLQGFHLPTMVRRNLLQITADEMVSLMQFDKKNTQQGLKLILLRKIGDAMLVPAPSAEILAAAITPALET